MKQISAVRSLCVVAVFCLFTVARSETESDPTVSAPFIGSVSDSGSNVTSGLVLGQEAKGSTSKQGLQMNFRGVPLEAVLNYLSEAAGFAVIVDEKVRLEGTVEAWSAEPLDREEALGVLTSALKHKAYSPIAHAPTFS